MKKTIITVALILVAGVVLANVVFTTPELVRSEIGGSGVAAYDQIRTLSIRIDPVNGSIDHRFEVFDSTDAARPAFPGQYTVSGGTAELRVDDVGLRSGLTLSAGQQTAVQSAIDSYVAQVEGSMISFGLVDGVQQ